MVLFEGLTSSGKAKVVNVDDEGNLVVGSSPTPSGSLQEGTDISGATMPAGGASGRGWLSAIWLLINTRFPALGQALSSASTPVVLPASQITALTPPTTITANLDATDSGYLDNLNTAIGTPITGATMPTGGTGWFGWLSAIWLLINTRFPAVSITDITGTIASSGDNTIIVSPGAGLSIYITRLIIQNESTTATTIILKDSSSNKLRNLAQLQGDGIALIFAERREIKLAQNSPLILNLSGANSVGYSMGYYLG